ncbi:hypothetical protein GUITHDRAFT_75356, partial [Guillardia theta CCMP2712]
RRQEDFGLNEHAMEPQDSILKIAWDALQDPSLLFLCFASLVSLVIGVVSSQSQEIVEGIAILAAVLVVVTVTAVNDYHKEKQFRSLREVQEEVWVTVIRDSAVEQVLNKDLVVGDVVLLSAGDMVCADGIILDQSDLQVSEQSLTGESSPKRKGSSLCAPSAHLLSPAIFSGTFVQEGEGKMVVLAVGPSTYQASIQESMKEDMEGCKKSILQLKLDSMTTTITKVGAAAGILTVLVLLARFSVGFVRGECCKERWVNSIHLPEILDYLITGVTIFVVAVPEGLPLAITVALALSVRKMMNDNNLVRHLSASETMGSVSSICSDKTGTLTSGRMTAVRVWVSGQDCILGEEGRAGEPLAELPRGVRELLAYSLAINTSFKSNVSYSRDGQVSSSQGNETECALLRLVDMLLNIQEKRRCLTFSSDRKRMSTIVGDDTDRIDSVMTGRRIFCKGAPEVVIPLCSRIISSSSFSSSSSSAAVAADNQPMTVELRARADGMACMMGKEGLRPIAVAFRDMEEEEDVDELSAERDLVLLAIVGLEDPLRAEVPAAIRACQQAGITVRMVTGDNEETAISIAKKCGILPQREMNEKEMRASVFTGKQFRELVGEKEDIDMEQLEQILPKLRILARSTPLDKLALVGGIQDSESCGLQTVAVTGDGTNDAPALLRAHIGLAMGKAGTQVAQNAADIIILDDNFASILQAVKWGRNVHDNICKFLQFQLTVNCSACILAVVGGSVLSESPLTAMQLLWVNMIMDSLASLSLASEDPSPDLLKRPPCPRDQPLLSPAMVKFVLGHAAWQILVLSFLVFGMGDVCSPDIANPNVCAPAESLPTTHYTIVFTCFVFLQLFNQINARKIHGEVNVFKGIFDNMYFLIITMIELLCQCMMVQVTTKE